MDQFPPQDLLRGVPQPPVNPASLPPEYWASLDSLYTNADPSSHQQTRDQHAQQHQQQNHLQTPSQPLGITWDHPVFSQNQPPLSSSQSRSPLPQPDQIHGLYDNQTPQAWRGDSLQNQPMMSTTPSGYGISPQYRPLQPYPQGQMSLESQSLSTPENPAFHQSFAYSRNYFPQQQLSVPDTPSQHPQQTTYHNEVPSMGLDPYALSTGFPDDPLASMSFPHDFPEVTPNLPTQNTINPQLVAQQQTQVPGQQSNYTYLNMPGFERQNEPKAFDYFRNDLQMPVLGQQSFNASPGITHPSVVSINGQIGTMPNVPAVGARKKQPGTKKQTKKVSKKAPGRMTNGKTNSSSSESETDDSDLEIISPEEPSPIPPARPSDPEAAIQYDTLQAVWSPRNRRPNAEKVKSALVAFKDVVKTVRDSWKEKSQAMKAAENKNENEKATQIKKDVVLQRRLMDVVVSTTLEKGHPMIVEKLGEHPMAVAAVYSFMLDRHQASDIDGAFNISLLKLLSRFVTMDEDVLNKTNVAKLLPRFVKKGGPIVRELSQKILDNAAASTKRKQDAAKASSKENSPSKSATANVPDATGTKRPREGEINGQPATKRMVVPSGAKNALKPSTPSANGPSKRAQEPGQENRTNPTASRPKANIVAPKPTNLFGSLSSASKRPGTSNAERAAAAAAAAKSGTPAKKEPQPAPSKPTFSFGDLMADLNKQKDPTPSEPVEEKPPESEEERERRLRKEARRRLRVTWKPDSSLTEVRFFTHDPDEELGPGDRSREAGDVKGEGSVLKLHRDLDELEDDEDGGIREENLLEYREPSEIDLAGIEHGNYTKRGGAQQPVSPEKTAQEHREATTLMVFYTSPAEVPPSPKEPPPSDAEESVPEVLSFGELPDHVKARQERYYAMVNPKRATSAQPAPQNTPQGAPFDISNLLKILQNAPQTPQHSTPPPVSQPVSQPPMSDLERTISMFSQPQPQQQAPNPLLSMPQFPALSQPTATQGIDFQKILSAMNPMQQTPTPPQAQQSQPSIAPNLAAIISQLSNQNQQASQASGQYEDPERKRMRENGGYDGHDDNYGYSKRPKSGTPNKKHPKAGMVACRYWAEGRCRKGDDCTYRHDPLN
ncbi:hypothetical protein BDV59DRAFT_153471 [Aspergillus ambiguus]|uniref:uncharacterized protein n=1 Tax=Aspergillus ambiguus TaxID=176160 RepID=UPI003CCD58EC